MREKEKERRKEEEKERGGERERDVNNNTFCFSHNILKVHKHKYHIALDAQHEILCYVSSTIQYNTMKL